MESSHKSHFTTEPKAQERNDILIDAKRNGEDVQMDKSEDDIVDDRDIYRDL
jgi:hypothetical protein